MRVSPQLEADIRGSWNDPDAVHSVCLDAAKDQMTYEDLAGGFTRWEDQVKASFHIGLAFGSAKKPNAFITALRELRLP